MSPRRNAPLGASLALLVVPPLTWLFGGCGDSVTVGDVREPSEPSFTHGDAAPSEADASLTEYCPATSCPAPFTTCPGSRFPCDVNLLSDRGNCGSCGFACPFSAGLAEFACIEGRCKVVSCTNGSADCNGLVDDDCEVKFGTDANCNSCGDKCPDPAKPCIYDSYLEKGQCGCPSGSSLCGRNCIDLRSSDENCDACGAACDPLGGGAPPRDHAHYGCLGGGCGNLKCDRDWANCDSDILNGCETSTLSFENCGGCNKACEPGQACVRNRQGFGECICPLGKTLCDGVCVDIGSDPWHCGGCGRACTMIAPNKNGVALCSYGSCGFSCVSGFGDCNGDLSDGCEINLGSDPYNCGACGQECQVGQPCIAGRCAVEPCDAGIGGAR